MLAYGIVVQDQFVAILEVALLVAAQGCLELFEVPNYLFYNGLVRRIGLLGLTPRRAAVFADSCLDDDARSLNRLFKLLGYDMTRRLHTAVARVDGDTIPFPNAIRRHHLLCIWRKEAFFIRAWEKRRHLRRLPNHVLGTWP